MSDTIACQHDIGEQISACVDGLCPRCLQAEIERLQADIKTIHIQKEADIRRIAIECGKAKAEIERLREQLHYANGTCDLAMKHRDEAEADNERLRAALQQIEDRYETAGDSWSAYHMRAIARRAREHKPHDPHR